MPMSLFSVKRSGRKAATVADMRTVLEQAKREHADAEAERMQPYASWLRSIPAGTFVLRDHPDIELLAQWFGVEKNAMVQRAENDLRDTRKLDSLTATVEANANRDFGAEITTATDDLRNAEAKLEEAQRQYGEAYGRQQALVWESAGAAANAGELDRLRQKLGPLAEAD